MCWRLADLWAGPFLAPGLQSSEGMPVDLDTRALSPILAYMKWMGIYHSVYSKKIYALDTVMGDGFDSPDGQ
jgi:hypothetical protein